MTILPNSKMKSSVEIKPLQTTKLTIPSGHKWVPLGHVPTKHTNTHVDFPDPLISMQKQTTRGDRTDDRRKTEVRTAAGDQSPKDNWNC